MIKNPDFSDNEIEDAIKSAIEIHNIPIKNHRDYQGNNLLLWLAATNRYIEKFYKFFDEQNFYQFNNYDLSVYELLMLIKTIYLYEKFDENESYINLGYETKLTFSDTRYTEKIKIKKNEIFHYFFTLGWEYRFNGEITNLWYSLKNGLYKYSDCFDTFKPTNSKRKVIK